MDIPVFFSEQMVADAASYSPSAGKPGLVVQSWLAAGHPLDIIAPTPVSRAQLARAHDPAYVDGVLDARMANGFANCSASVAASLPYTCGAMLDACHAALDNGIGAVAPCSGFHHAGYRFGGGFCTFNGLLVAAMDLFAHRRAQRVGILDLDMHWGNGSQDIIDQLGLADRVVHDSRSHKASEAERFLAGLARHIENRFGQCDLLIYQAGADSHIEDPLGGYLTTGQMHRRDRTVFETCRSLQLPVAWNLAGGYQRDADGGIAPVLALHDNTMNAFAQTAWNAPTALHASRP